MKAALISAGLITCSVPLSTSAMLIGDVVVHSHLGQPLRASISLKADPGEELDTRCFSLARPEGQVDYASYLTQASLKLVESGGLLHLQIHSAQAINEPVLRLLVRGDCGQGRLNREFAILLDPVEYAQALSSPVKAAVATEPQIPVVQNQYIWETRLGETLRSIAASLYPRDKRMQRSLQRAIRDANPEVRGMPVDAPLPEGSMLQVPVLSSIASVPVPAMDAISKSKHISAVANKPVSDLVVQAQPSRSAAQENGFRLKLSTDALDLSVVGKMTEAQRQHLREKQSLLDADDQVANTLSMKNRIRQLEEQIDSMKKALDQTNSRMLLSEKLATPPQQKAVSPSADTRSNWASWLENTSFRSLAGVGLILALLVSGWWRWRRRQAEAQLESELEQEFAISEMPKYEPLTPLRSEQRQVNAAKPETAEQEDDFLSSVTSIFDNEGESVTFTEAESVLDEADLYLAYGWANRAVELLQEYLEKHPEDALLWKKLFETYAFQGMRQEFEQLALRCQSTMDDSSLWVLVQKLGRQLDAENPLYLSNPEEREEAAPDSAAEAETEEGEVPTLVAPLDFVLDEKPAQKAEVDKEIRHLELDPLFAEPDQNAQLLDENGNRGKATD